MGTFLMHERPRFSRVVRRRWKHRFVYALLIVVMSVSFIGLLGFLSHRDGYLIVEIQSKGNTLLPGADIASETKEFLAGSYLALFPKNNIFLLRKGALIAALQSAFPVIESADVKKLSFTSIAIEVREREPYALWCSLQVDIGHPCFFVDRNGLLFYEAPIFSEQVYLTFSENGGRILSVGEHVFTETRFSEFFFFIQSLDTLGLNVKEIRIEPGAGDLEDYALVLGQGTELFISNSLELDRTLENITDFFSDQTLMSSRDAFLEGISYIDFRFGNKVYYK